MSATPEFSHPLSIEGITPDAERAETITANDKECAALCQRFDLRNLSDFTASFRIRRVAGSGTVRVTGTLEAEVVQACVVSLRDVHAHVTGEFETYFGETAHDLGEDVDILLDDPESSPEMIVNGHIDLGEVAAQYLSLNLDPYPRAPGVSLAAQLAEIGADVRNNPFAVLKVIDGDGAKVEKPKAESKPLMPPQPAVAKVHQPTESRMARLKWYPPMTPEQTAAVQAATAKAAAPAQPEAAKKPKAKKAAAKKPAAKKPDAKKKAAKKPAAKKPVKKAAKKVVKKGVKKTVKKAAKKPVKKAKPTAKKPVKKQAKMPVKKPMKKHLKKPVKKAAKKAAPKAKAKKKAKSR